MCINEMCVPLLTLISLPKQKYYSELVVSLQTFVYEYSKQSYIHMYMDTHIFCLYIYTHNDFIFH